MKFWHLLMADLVHANNDNENNIRTNRFEEDRACRDGEQCMFSNKLSRLLLFVCFSFFKALVWPSGEGVGFKVHCLQKRMGSNPIASTFFVSFRTYFVILPFFTRLYGRGWLRRWS